MLQTNDEQIRLRANGDNRTLRHKKSGKRCNVVGRARVQASTVPLKDDDEVLVYREVQDGSLWVRGYSEFYDGRFEEVPLRPTGRMVYIRHTAVLADFLLRQIHHPVPDFITVAIGYEFTTDTRCENLLYDTLNSMMPEFRNAFLYHHDGPKFKEVATWWEHQMEIELIAQRDREERQHQESLRKQALAKLTAEERSALGV